jgi:hypothetical protein
MYAVIFVQFIYIDKLQIGPVITIAPPYCGLMIISNGVFPMTNNAFGRYLRYYIFKFLF